MRIFVTVLAACFCANSLSAQVIDSKTARKQLFSTKSEVIQLSNRLTEKDGNIIKALVPLMEKQMRTPVKFYSSIAYSPDEGLVSDALQGAFNFHNIEAADKAAIKACNAARKSGTKGCVLAARVLPKNYKARDLTMSFDATNSFNSVYRKKRGTKAFAISKTTGAWGFGDSEEAAISACKEGRSLNDCRVVIQD